MVRGQHIMQAADTHSGLHRARTTGLETGHDPPLPGPDGRMLGE